MTDRQERLCREIDLLSAEIERTKRALDALKNRAAPPPERMDGWVGWRQLRPTTA